MTDVITASILQRWSPSTILLSYCISVTGSYCTIQLMGRWRRIRDEKQKRQMLVLSSLALGGCGIWCTHFTGMMALNLELPDKSSLSIDFELGHTLFSLIFAVFGVLIGLKIASSDPYFLEMEATRRNQILAADINHMRVSDSMHHNSSLRIKVPWLLPHSYLFTKKLMATDQVAALFTRPSLIVAGGLFAALGVLGMHYLGMLAQHTQAKMTLDPGLVVLSVVIAINTTTVAFWIIFRALVFMPNSELLRLGSALIMGGAISATHYCGMAAAVYTPVTNSEVKADSSVILVNGEHAANAASHVSLLVCYWLTIFSVVRNIHKPEETAMTPGSKMNTVQSPRPHDILQATAENVNESSYFTSLKVHVDER